ncbi:MAG: hypothetical protein RLZZ444_740 [Pseudomonadota bacterium]
MSAVPTRPITSQTFFRRLAGMDLFSVYLSGFIILYGLVSIGLEHIVGIVGFAKTPYLNAGAYAYSLGFFVLALLFDKVRLAVLVPHPLAIAMLIAGFISAVVGFSNGNAAPYIGAWSLYIVTGVLMFQLFRHARHGKGDVARTIDSLYSLPFLALMLVFAFLSIFNKDNHYQYVLFEVIALYGVLMRRSLIEKAISAIIYLCIHLGSNEGFVQIEINRASILAIGATGLIFMLYRRYLVTLFFVIFAAIGGLLYALSLDDATVELLPRNVKEAILLMKGDDIYNHVSSYQRVYEGQKVMEDYEQASDAEWLFGKGLGRTVDMAGSVDRTVGQHALLGVNDVHNIHFLHYAVFHKFGLAGLTLLALIVAGVVFCFSVDLVTGRLDRGRMFLYFYLVYNLVFAMPASNFLLANPLWPAFLGLLATSRLRDAKSLPEVIRDLALTRNLRSGRTFC